MARIITQNVSFDLPSNKKQMDFIQRNIQLFEKKKWQAVDSIKSSTLQFNRACEALGIIPSFSSPEIRKQLFKSTEKIPVTFGAIFDTIKDSLGAIDYYKKFVDATRRVLNEKELEIELVPTLVRLLSSTSAYQVVVPTDDLISHQIDWGLDFSASDAVSHTPGDEASIDWGISLVETSGNASSAEAVISWDANPDPQSSLPIEDSPPVLSSEAEKKEPLFTLDSQDIRQLVLTELMELESFFSNRYDEEQSGPLIESAQVSRKCVKISHL